MEVHTHTPDTDLEGILDEGKKRMQDTTRKDHRSKIQTIEVLKTCHKVVILAMKRENIATGRLGNLSRGLSI
jgi:hypothetical protein